MPDFNFEIAASGVVAGLDEAGYGPWAGPVVAGAVILNRNTLEARLIANLDDSKKLSPSRRASLFEALNASKAVITGVGIASVEEIDVLNILRATHLAMARAVDHIKSPIDLVLVDGNRVPELSCEVRAIIKGDSRSLSIAAASIIAKVTRDRMMSELAELFPGYGWQTNKGYGTAEHRDALERLGVTPFHRRSYAPIKEFLKNT